MTINYPGFKFKYCVMKYEPFYDRCTVIGEFIRRQDAKEFAEVLKMSVDEQAIEATMKHRQDNDVEHGKFWLYPEYIFACQVDLIEDYVDLFFDDVVESVLIEY